MSAITNYFYYFLTRAIKAFIFIMRAVGKLDHYYFNPIHLSFSFYPIQPHLHSALGECRATKYHYIFK
jgi:hypothetical protein